MRAAAFVLTLALLALAVLPSQERASAGNVGLCFGQTYDAKNIGAQNYFWEGISSCPINVPAITVATWLYRYDWNSGNWQLVQFLDGDLKANANWAAKSGLQSMPSYFGINCFSAWSVHTAWTLNSEDAAFTASGGQCY